MTLNYAYDRLENVVSSATTQETWYSNSINLLPPRINDYTLRLGWIFSLWKRVHAKLMPVFTVCEDTGLTEL